MYSANIYFNRFFISAVVIITAGFLFSPSLSYGWSPLGLSTGKWNSEERKWDIAQFPAEDSSVYGLRLSLPYAKNKKVYGFDIAIGAGLAKKVRGFQFGLATYVDDMYGIQTGFGGRVNKLKGIQIKGFYAGTDDGDGLQLAGIVNNTGVFTGIQFTGIVNFSGSVSGLQVGGLFNLGDEVKGIQVAGLVNHVRKGSGLQLSVLANNVGGGGLYGGEVEDSYFKGIQVSYYNNVGGDFSGLQVGLYNRAKNAKGIQIGVVNVAESMKGVQIGLLNVIKSNTTMKYMPVINIGF